MNGALETLISQAIGRSNSKSQSIACLNRGRIIVALAFVPIVALLWPIDKVLVAIGQDPETSRYARVYVVGQLPGLFMQAQFDCNMRYLSAYKKSYIPMLTQLVSTILHVGWCQLLISHCRLGVCGASLAICITYSTNFAVLVFYTTVIDKDERIIWSLGRQAFSDSSSYLRLGIPGTLMIMLDMWCYEIITL